MRPRRRTALLTPPSLTFALPQNVANSCICHTSEKSPVTPIIATDPKMRSRKSCVCHTCDPLPPSSISSPSPLPTLATSHSSLPRPLARGCKFAPLFSSSYRMLPPQPFSFHAFAWLPGGGRGVSSEFQSGFATHQSRIPLHPEGGRTNARHSTLQSSHTVMRCSLLAVRI